MPAQRSAGLHLHVTQYVQVAQGTAQARLLITHQITSEKGTTITVGASTIHIGPDSIVIQSPKVLLNPGEDAAANASLGGTTPTQAN